MISIHPKIIYRVPCFPIDAKLIDHWSDLKNAIAASSPDFYSHIEDIEKEDLPILSAKITQTIWKYFNRARFRATPYGIFAGIGMVGLSDQETCPIVIADEQQLYEFVDWGETETLAYEFKTMLRLNVLLLANSSYYRIGDIIRFLAKTKEGFVLSEIDSDSSILDILHRCGEKIRIAEFSQEPETMELIEHLISSQLLFTSLMPNIIGEDYFDRMGTARLKSPSLKYIIAERQQVRGGLDQTLLKHLPDAANLLNQLNQPVENPKLRDFIKRFTKKFEQNEVPILTALDPELGIGYDDLEVSTNEDPFLAELITGNKKEGLGLINLSDALVKILIDQSASKPFIELESLAIKNYKTASIPNTTSVLCYSCDEKIIVESIGGCTANALLGRFTHANNELHSFCKEIASIEEEANPDVLFFDIAYRSEGTVDNVNRRKSIYSYQLSILDYDTSENPLALNDLKVSVVGEVLVLRSATMNKRLIPKMATAYNSTRSDLSVFRLLCDIQHQQINSSLNFSPSMLITGLDYYPAVTFKNIVLSTRKWKINYHSDSQVLAQKFQQILSAGCRFVRHGLADQTLCFDLASQFDLDMLANLVKKQKWAYVDEVMIGNDLNVADTTGKNHLAQFMITLYHKRTLYNGFSKPLIFRDASVQRSFLPGSEWLYFQIFSHPSRTDDLLIHEVSDLLQDSADLLAFFFFIRYNEDGDHIRLRVKLNNVSFLPKFLNFFSERLRLKTEQGLISTVRICTYQREGDRYGWNNITAVEGFFFADSKSTLAILATEPSIQLKYHYTLQIIKAVRLSGLFEPKEFHALLDNVCSGFQIEHNFGLVEFKKLNEHYKKFTAYAVAFKEIDLHFPVKFIVSELVAVFQSCQDKAKRRQLFIDLIHMHVNRLHTSQRYHEAVIYYFAVKDLLKEEALQKQSFHC